MEGKYLIIFSLICHAKDILKEEKELSINGLKAKENPNQISGRKQKAYFTLLKADFLITTQAYSQLFILFIKRLK